MVANAQTRLSAIVVRLGGPALPSYEPTASAAETKSPAGARPFRADEEVLRHLEQRFLALHEMSDEPQARGRHFETLLSELFNAWGMDARGGFHVSGGEQIDGSFQHANDTYLLEAKWHRAKTDANTLHGFQGKVNERPEWTRGLFVSFSGFTEVGLQAFT
ncbi:restriction endonuclease, partial [Xanthobacter sediminis]|uniref:restriction endonuclease n=1 Tax=Xanthobacter sediminis TaxID=3119926 RepID=UPI0037273BDB